MFDGRSILILLSAFYFGTIPTLITAASLSSYRYYLTIYYNDSVGLIPGLLWIIIPTIIGLSWRFYRLRGKEKSNTIPHSEQYLMFLITQIIVTSILFLFPKSVSIDSIAKIAPTLILIYPISGYIVSVFMMKIRRNYFLQKEISKREQEYINLFNSVSFCTLLVDAQTHYIVNANEEAKRIYGFTLDEFITLKPADISIYGALEMKNLFSKKTSYDNDYFRSKHRIKNGNIINVEIRKKFQRINDVEYIIINIIDVTKRVKDEQSLQNTNEKLKVTLKGVTNAIFVLDEYGNVEVVNDRGLSFVSSPNYIGEPISKIVQVDSNQNIELNSVVLDCLQNEVTFQSSSDFYIYDNEAKQHIVEFSLSPIKFKENQVSGAILIINDVTKRQIESKQNKYNSQHDHHTGLYNRYFFDAELQRLNTARQLPISILMGDINGLKIINDTFGHMEGDLYIKIISDILKSATRVEDIVARWGGDEFVILLPQTSKEDALIIAARIKDLCEKSRYQKVTPSISLGIATKVNNKQDINGVLLLAEEEMYSNKQKEGKKLRNQLLKNIYSSIHNIHPDIMLHAKRLMDDARQFGEYLNLSKEEIKTLVVCAHRHDIAWITVADKEFDKTKKLIEQDLSFNSKFPEISYRISKAFPELSHVSKHLESLQENYDGTGIPYGLQGEEISKLSRIIQILDYFDVAKTKDLSDETVLNELSSLAGKRFDPNLVNKYINYKKNA